MGLTRLSVIGLGLLAVSLSGTTAQESPQKKAPGDVLVEGAKFVGKFESIKPKNPAFDDEVTWQVMERKKDVVYFKQTGDRPFEWKMKGVIKDNQITITILEVKGDLTEQAKDGFIKNWSAKARIAGKKITAYAVHKGEGFEGRYSLQLEE
jgi:hypothetical protein